jgi:hypothetical protein
MKQKDLAIIFGSIAIFTILWVGFSLWHAYTTSTIKEPLTSQLLQIPGTFNTQVINDLKQRTNISSNNLTLRPATPSGTTQDTPSSLLSPKASLSATPTPTALPILNPVPLSSPSAGGGV